MIGICGDRLPVGYRCLFFQLESKNRLTGCWPPNRSCEKKKRGKSCWPVPGNCFKGHEGQQSHGGQRDRKSLLDRINAGGALDFLSRISHAVVDQIEKKTE